MKDAHIVLRRFIETLFIYVHAPQLPLLASAAPNGAFGISQMIQTFNVCTYTTSTAIGTTIRSVTATAVPLCKRFIGISLEKANDHKEIEKAVR
jgi:hypothetical protein